MRCRSSGQLDEPGGRVVMGIVGTVDSDYKLIAEQLRGAGEARGAVVAADES